MQTSVNTQAKGEQEKHTSAVTSLQEGCRLNHQASITITRGTLETPYWPKVWVQIILHGPAMTWQLVLGSTRSGSTDSWNRLPQHLRCPVMENEWMVYRQINKNLTRSLWRDESQPPQDLITPVNKQPGAGRGLCARVTWRTCEPFGLREKQCESLCSRLPPGNPLNQSKCHCWLKTWAPPPPPPPPLHLSPQTPIQLQSSLRPSSKRRQFIAW